MAVRRDTELGASIDTVTVWSDSMECTSPDIWPDLLPEKPLLSFLCCHF